MRCTRLRFSTNDTTAFTKTYCALKIEEISDNFCPL